MQKPKFTIKMVLDALEACGGNRQLALAQLKCSPATLHSKIAAAKKQGLQVPQSAHRHPPVSEVVLPENMDDLPEAEEGQPSIGPQKSLVAQLAIDPELIRQVGNTYGRRLDIHIAGQNWDAAQAVIDEARRDALGEQAVTPLLEVTLDEAGVPVRSLNPLEDHCQVMCVGDLAKVTTKQLLAIPNFGPNMLDVLWWSVLKLAARRDAMREGAQMDLQDLKRNHSN